MNVRILGLKIFPLRILRICFILNLQLDLFWGEKNQAFEWKKTPHL